MVEGVLGAGTRNTTLTGDVRTGGSYPHVHTRISSSGKSESYPLSPPAVSTKVVRVRATGGGNQSPSPSNPARPSRSYPRLPVRTTLTHREWVALAFGIRVFHRVD